MGGVRRVRDERTRVEEGGEYRKVRGLRREGGDKGERGVEG